MIWTYLFMLWVFIGFGLIGLLAWGAHQRNHGPVRDDEYNSPWGDV